MPQNIYWITRSSSPSSLLTNLMNQTYAIGVEVSKTEAKVWNVGAREEVTKYRIPDGLSNVIPY